jgi:predicted nucleic acid-binding protein
MVIVDTGFWLALADQQDAYHKSAKRTLQQIDEPLITTWCVVTETCIEDIVSSYMIDVSDEIAETEIMIKHNPDVEYWISKKRMLAQEINRN